MTTFNKFTAEGEATHCSRDNKTAALLQFHKFIHFKHQIKAKFMAYIVLCVVYAVAHVETQSAEKKERFSVTRA